MSKKKPKKTTSWTRLKASPLFHWAQRYTSPETQESPIHSKVLTVTADNIEQASQVSVAVELLEGQAPPALQSAFNKVASAKLAEFEKSFPDFKYSPGGRPRKAS